MRVVAALLSASIAASVALATAAVSASTADVLAAPRLFLQEAAPRSTLTADFFLPHAILDLREVMEHPVVRARQDYSRITGLPVVGTSTAAALALPMLGETRTVELSKSVVLTFPLAVTGRNFMTAEFVGVGRLLVAPTSGFMGRGGVFAFSSEF